MKNAQFKVVGKTKGDMRVDLNMRDLAMILDEPTNLGGTNKGASPVEAAVAALSGCVSIMISLVAKRMNITVNAVDTDADFDLDMRGVMFIAETGNPFKTIRLSVTVDAVMTQEQFVEMQDEVRKYCPLHNLFTAAGTEIIEDWQLK